MKNRFFTMIISILFISLLTGCDSGNNLIQPKSNTKFEFNQTISFTDKYEYTFSEYKYGKKINGTFLDEDTLDNSQNNEYVAVLGTFKNISTEVIDSWDIKNIKLIYNDKYNYELICYSEDDVQPLSTANIFCYKEISKEVAEDTSSPLKIQLEEDGNIYELIIR